MQIHRLQYLNWHDWCVVHFNAIYFFRATLIAAMTERLKGGKWPQILKYRIAERQNSEKSMKIAWKQVPGNYLCRIQSFRISGDFPSFRLTGFLGIFRHSSFQDFGDFLSFRLLGFGVNLSRSMTPPFRRSTVLSFRLLGSPPFFLHFLWKILQQKWYAWRLILTVPVCTIVMEIETKQTFIQLVFLKAGMGNVIAKESCFSKRSFRPKSSASVKCNITRLFRHIWKFQTRNRRCLNHSKEVAQENHLNEI